MPRGPRFTTVVRLDVTDVGQGTGHRRLVSDSKVLLRCCVTSGVCLERSPSRVSLFFLYKAVAAFFYICYIYTALTRATQPMDYGSPCWSETDKGVTCLGGRAVKLIPPADMLLRVHTQGELQLGT